jgi:hypothetical protein
MAGFFGESDPAGMPAHLFWENRGLDYDSAIKADISRQDFTVCPRHWYVNATFACSRCGKDFLFSAEEQRFWYEELRFYVDSQPRQCQECRIELRQLKALRQEYDRVAAKAMRRESSHESKARLVAVIDALMDGGVLLPDQMIENRRILASQLERRKG